MGAQETGAYHGQDAERHEWSEYPDIAGGCLIGRSVGASQLENLGCENEKQDRQRRDDHGAEHHDVGQIAAGSIRITLADMASGKRTGCDHQTDVKCRCEKQDCRGKTHGSGQGTVGQLCDVEQIGKVDDEHGQQTYGGGERHGRYMPKRIAGKEYGGLCRDII